MLALFRLFPRETSEARRTRSDLQHLTSKTLKRSGKRTKDSCSLFAEYALALVKQYAAWDQV